MLSREVIVPPPKPVSTLSAMLLVTGLVVAGVLAVGAVVGPRLMCHGASKIDVARATVDRLAYEAYPAWLTDHPDRPCPPSLAALLPYESSRSAMDPWDTTYTLICRDVGITVVSAGGDGKLGTDDDIRSDRAP